MAITLTSESNLDAFNLAFLIFAQKKKTIQGFCFGIEVVKNSEWACVFCIAVIGGASRANLGVASASAIGRLPGAQWRLSWGGEFPLTDAHLLNNIKW